MIPSYFAQAVAIAAYEMGYEKAAAPIIEPTRESRKVLRAALTAEGVRFVMGDGYYAFIDCTPYIEAGGLGDSEGLLTYLGEQVRHRHRRGQIFLRRGRELDSLLLCAAAGRRPQARSSACSRA